MPRIFHCRCLGRVVIVTARPSGDTHSIVSRTLQSRDPSARDCLDSQSLFIAVSNETGQCVLRLGMLTRSHSEYVEGETLLDMIREDQLPPSKFLSRFNRDCILLAEVDFC
jgi:hypothetical protein